MTAESSERLRTLGIIVLGSFIMIYGLGARKIGGPQIGCVGTQAHCNVGRGFAWIPLIAVIVGSVVLASQCRTMRSFKNMYMLGVVVMSFAILSSFLGTLACGVSKEAQKINGCSGSAVSSLAHLGLSGLVIVVITTVALKIAQRRGSLQPDPVQVTGGNETSLNDATGQ